MSKCRHLALHFESGGYNIVCNDCKYSWAAVGHCPLKLISDPTARAHGFTYLDERHDPNSSPQPRYRPSNGIPQFSKSALSRGVAGQRVDPGSVRKKRT